MFRFNRPKIAINSEKALLSDRFFHAGQFDARTGRTQDANLQRPDGERLPRSGNPLVMTDDESGQRIVFAALLDIEAIFFVKILHLQSAREDVFVGTDLFFGQIGYVMLVLDFAENLLQHIFERDYARRTAELVDHHGDIRPVFGEILQ